MPRLTTYRNEHGYWVAKLEEGDYRGTKAWALHKKVAIRILEEVLLKMDGQVKTDV